jgi:hypothetical protein
MSSVNLRKGAASSSAAWRCCDRATVGLERNKPLDKGRRTEKRKEGQLRDLERCVTAQWLGVTSDGQARGEKEHTRREETGNEPRIVWHEHEAERKVFIPMREAYKLYYFERK